MAQGSFAERSRRYSWDLLSTRVGLNSLCRGLPLEILTSEFILKAFPRALLIRNAAGNYSALAFVVGRGDNEHCALIICEVLLVFD